MNHPVDMTLAGVRARYEAGLTPAQLMQELRNKALEFDSYNVFIRLLNETELAPYLERLSQMDKSSCPLWGIPFVMKDNIDLAGIPTTAACEAFTYTPDQSAVVVQQLINLGALPVGKANLDQFATGLNGTRSPWGACGNSFDPSLVSGGSSSGSAVSVALGLASFSLGTDTAGSGRIPACFNNLVGVKPSRGLLSASGVVPACRSLDCVSIFALHCDDANTFFGDKHYEAAYQSTIATLRDSGITLVEIDYSPFDEAARLLYEGPWVSERYVATLPLIKENPEAMFPVVRDIISGGETPSAAELFKAQYRLQDLRKRCAAIVDSVDALLTPTAGALFTIKQMLDKPVQHNSELGYYMNFVNLLDMAAIAVPTRFTDNGLPFGITLSAPAFSDRRLLSIANRIHEAADVSLGATGLTKPAQSNAVATRTDLMQLVVCGAHLQGLPLNHQLVDRGATLLEQTQTKDCYRLYALESGTVKRPALIRVDNEGAAIEVEVWQIPTVEVGSFLANVPAPLGLGRVQLSDGRELTGFIAEPAALTGAKDITALGGWRAYVA